MKLNRELAPKAKAKSSAVAKPKAHAASAAPAAKDENVQNLFAMRRHKRKTNDGHIFAYAIWSRQEQKQLVQLTNVAKEDAESIVERQVDALNNGTSTSQEVISYLNSLKG
eukprot:s1892_g8.t1